MLHRAGVRPIVLALLASAALACGGAPASTPPPTLTPTATPAPTPSPTPDPLEAFHEALGEPGYEASADIEGSIDIGPTFDVTGRLEILGEEFGITIVTDYGARTQSTEQRVVDDTTYVGQGEPMRWRAVTELTGPRRPTPFTEAVAGLDLERRGATYAVAGDDGRPVLEALGLVDQGIDVTGIAIAFGIDAAGTLTSMEAAFTSEIAGSTTGATWALMFTFDDRPDAGPFDVPEPLWVAYDPERAYTIWHPAGWKVDIDPDEDFTDFYVAPDESAYVVVYCVHDPALDLDEWAADGREFYTKEWAAEPGPVADGTLGDVPAKAFAWEAATVDDVQSFVISVAAVNDGLACDVQWIGARGNEAADGVLFGAFVASFVWTD